MTTIIELPKIPKLECGSSGKISGKDLDAYFKNIGRTVSRLSLQTDIPEVAAAVAAIRVIMEIMDEVTTKPFNNLVSAELDGKFRARELGKDLEEYFKKKIVDILLQLISIIGIPNPFTTPIPFLGRTPDGYDPVIMDMFTKEGQKKVKTAAQYDIEKVEKFLGIESTFNGDLGIKSPDLRSEETWHKIKNWFNQVINDFIGAVAEGIGKAVKNVPIIGKPIYDLVFSSIDPTIAIEASFDSMVKNFKAQIKQIKEDVLSGKLAEDISNKLINEMINKILNIGIPLIGTVGDLIDIDINKKDIICLEFDFHEIEDKFKELIQKARRFFKGGMIVKINDIIAKAPGYILTQFPIVGKIFKIVKQVADFLSGKNPLTECDVLNIIFPAIFSLGSLITAKLPGNIQIRYIE